jgi:hypothetical protein
VPFFKRGGFDGCFSDRLARIDACAELVEILLRGRVHPLRAAERGMPPTQAIAFAREHALRLR